MTTVQSPISINMSDTVRAMQFSPSPKQNPEPQQPPADDEAASLALAMQLQEEDNAYATSWQSTMVSPERQEQSTEDEESLALAIRLQQEEDEAQLRNTLGLEDGEDTPDSPSNYSYEQLLRLSDTVGTVSKGASSESVDALCVMDVATARTDPAVIIGEMCSICRMEYEEDDTLRVLPCKHCEHAECLDQWLKVSKCCPLCNAEVTDA